MKPDGTLYFKNREDWREWLEKNHADAKEAWLIHYRKHVGKPGVQQREAVEEAICFGWIDGKLKRIDEERYALRFSPRKTNSVWSRINKDTAERMIESGLMTKVGLEKIEAAKKSGSWDKAYTNRERERMPRDLKAALMSNERAWTNFQRFANSYWNMYVGWVTGAKAIETRRKRINEVVKRSAVNKKPGV
jgi:uncharacterized protein YdeI (YjbR/CyaY-like superfamily)